MSEIPKPIFIIASERSGTNLLKLRLSDLLQTHIAPSPVHFLKHLYYQQPYYGDLENNDNFIRYISDAIMLCTNHFSPWDIDWEPGMLVQEYANNTRCAINVMHFMMQKYARENGCNSYICKDNYLYEFALDIAFTIPGSVFIYLYRDPRDVVLSQLQRPGSSRSVTKYSRLWEYEQTRSILAHEKLLKSGRSVAVSYEEFIQSECATLTNILETLNINLSMNAKNSEQNINNQTALEDVHEWQNLTKPTLTSNHSKYKKHLKSSHVKRVESICKDQMTYHGFEFEFSNHVRPTSLNCFIESVYGNVTGVFNYSKKKRGPLHKTRLKMLERYYVNYRCDR